MNAKTASFASLLILLMVGTPAFSAPVDKAATSQAPARLTKQAARDIAQARVPNGAFEHAELEKEGGRLIWSIDLRPNGSNDIIEIQIDAYSGEVVATATETPAQQRAERNQDARERKQK